MKEFWRKHCTTVIACIMLIAIIVLLYIIISSTPFKNNENAQAGNSNQAPPSETDEKEFTNPEIKLNKHPREAIPAGSFSAVQALFGSGKETLLDCWSFNGAMYIIVSTDSNDLDFGSEKPSLSVAVLNKSGTLEKVALYGSNPAYLAGKITQNGLLLLLSDELKTTLTLFNGESFRQISSFPKASSASAYLTDSEAVFILSAPDGVYFCKENGNKKKLSGVSAEALEIILFNDTYYLFFDKMIITADSELTDIKSFALSKTLSSVLPTVIGKEFGFLTVEKEGGVFYSAFYKKTALNAAPIAAEKLLVLGRAESVFLSESENGYFYTLNAGTAAVLSVNKDLSSPALTELWEAESAFCTESFGSDAYLIVKEKEKLYLVKRGARIEKTALIDGSDGKILVSDGKIWAVVCGKDITLLLCC